MPDPIEPERQPKGDHNRRLSLGLDPDQFAAEAGISTEQLRDYERTGPDHRFDAAVAARVGAALKRLEARLPNSQTGRQDAAVGQDAAMTGRQPATPLGDRDPKGPRYTAGDGDKL